MHQNKCFMFIINIIIIKMFILRDDIKLFGLISIAFVLVIQWHEYLQNAQKSNINILSSISYVLCVI